MSSVREVLPPGTCVAGVADALDTLVHARPASAAGRLAEALDALRRAAGTKFDPRVVEATLAIPEARWAELLGDQTQQAEVAPRR